ncbi:MAG TPA: hypothetical protein VEC99_05760, partial [Clostridia bacterium]|nr:hypothetical protein [Clostridia bacterium]
MKKTEPVNRMASPVVWPWAALCGTLLSCSGNAEGVPAAQSSTGFQKPAWLTDLSIGVKESYDNNVFLSGVESRFLPATYPVPEGSAVALKERSSWVTTVSPKVGFNFAPLLGSQHAISVLSLGYAPDFAIYHDEDSESYNAHRLAQTIKLKSGDFSLSLDNGFNYIDGSDVGPTYPGGLLNALATAAPRERREQFQDRGKVSLQYDINKWFVRPTASLLYFDLRTVQQNVAGYQNYADRYDVNGGADVGYRVNPNLALTLGYRYGHQYQEQYSFSPYSSPSDYNRVLLGVEGKPLKWLKLELQGGPDFRSYAPDSAAHLTPVNDKDPVKYYGEASVTAEVSAKDTLAFKYRQFQWVSSTGRIPYFDSLYDLNYRHKFTPKFTMDLGARLLTWDYSSGNLVPTNRRDDWQY